MTPFRIHAYEVTPQRLQSVKSIPRGGAFKADDKFKQVLSNYLTKSKLEKKPEVGFRFDPKSGVQHHPIRNLILDYCFGQPATAKKASQELATRLSKSMDDRSPHTLLMLIAYKDQNNENFRRVILWAFPKDQPFQFSSEKDTAKIKIPEDTFSRSSSIKKGALFEGFNSDASFLQGYVIDQQAQNSLNDAAAYWVDKFLECQFSLTGIAGTRLLAKTLRLTYDNLIVQQDKNQVSDSITAAFTSLKKKRSLKSYAEEYFTGQAKETFLAQAPPESFDNKFEFIKAEFEEKVQLRVFRLNDEVVISAPFATIDTQGGSVRTQTNKNAKTIRVSGTIVEETVKPGRKRKPPKDDGGNNVPAKNLG